VASVKDLKRGDHRVSRCRTDMRPEKLRKNNGTLSDVNLNVSIAK